MVSRRSWGRGMVGRMNASAGGLDVSNHQGIQPGHHPQSALQDEQVNSVGLMPPLLQIS